MEDVLEIVLESAITIGTSFSTAGSSCLIIEFNRWENAAVKSHDSYVPRAKRERERECVAWHFSQRLFPSMTRSSRVVVEFLDHPTPFTFQSFFNIFFNPLFRTRDQSLSKANDTFLISIHYHFIKWLIFKLKKKEGMEISKIFNSLLLSFHD